MGSDDLQPQATKASGHDNEDRVVLQRFGPRSGWMHLHWMLSFPDLERIGLGPLGAPLGDLLSQPAANGGHGLGTVATRVSFLVVIVGLVIFRSHRLNSQQKPAGA